jgi:ABC-type transport system involved in multi-copper enzyme maturation permease subunit
MSPLLRAIALVLSVVFVIVAVTGAYGYGASSVSDSKQETISSLQSNISYLRSHPTISVTTSTTISRVTSTVTTLSAVTLTTTQFPSVPWNGSVTFMRGPPGAHVAISFGGQLSDALLFNCQTASTTGCSAEEYDNDTGTNVSITVKYPLVNQIGEPSWANCVWSVAELPNGPALPGGPTFDYCVAVGSTAFVVADPGPVIPSAP